MISHRQAVVSEWYVCLYSLRDTHILIAWMQVNESDLNIVELSDAFGRAGSNPVRSALLPFESSILVQSWLRYRLLICADFERKEQRRAL